MVGLGGITQHPCMVRLGGITQHASSAEFWELFPARDADISKLHHPSPSPFHPMAHGLYLHVWPPNKEVFYVFKQTHKYMVSVPKYFLQDCTRGGGAEWGVWAHQAPQ